MSPRPQISPDLSKEYRTEEEEAALLGKSVRTLKLWRQKGIGPPYTYNGDEVLYRKKSTSEYLLSQEVVPVRTKPARHKASAPA